MGFFNNLGDKISGAGNVLANKTKNMGQVMDLESKISSCQKQLTEDFSKLGLFVYENNFKIDNPEYESMINRIHMVRNTIAEAQQKIAELKTQKVCPYCGNVLDGSPTFCTSCGKALNVTVVELPKQFCPKCGSEVENGSTFCTKCGTNLESFKPGGTN